MNKKISLLSIIAIVAIGTIGLMSMNSQEEIQVTQQIVTHEKGTLKNYSVEQLTEGTPYAIIGKVKQVTPVVVETKHGERVFSDVKVKVHRDLYGNYNENEITVRILGGEVPTRMTISHFSPSFEKNEKVLFFVADKEPDSIYGDNYYVAGLGVGKYSLNDKNDDAVKHSSSEKKQLRDIVSKIQQTKGLN